MTILLQDSFDRANATTAIGTPDVGGPYTVTGGSVGILSNQLYTTVTTLTYASYAAAFNVSSQASIAVPAATAAAGIGLTIRQTDTNNWWGFIPQGTGTYALVRNSTGTITQFSNLFPVANGTTVNLSAYGNYLYVYVGGVLVATQQDYWVGAGGTQAAIRTTGSAAVRLDDLLTQDLAAAPVAGTTGGSVYQLAGSTLNGAGFAYLGRDTHTEDEGGVA